MPLDTTRPAEQFARLTAADYKRLRGQAAAAPEIAITMGEASQDMGTYSDTVDVFAVWCDGLTGPDRMFYEYDDALQCANRLAQRTA